MLKSMPLGVVVANDGCAARDRNARHISNAWCAVVVAWLISFCSNGAAARQVAVAAETRLAYQIEWDLMRQELRMEVAVARLDFNCRDVAFELADWGEWTDVDSFYLRQLRGNPPVERDPEFHRVRRVQTPGDWGGKVLLTYRIPLVDADSPIRQRHGLLPWTKSDRGADGTESSYAVVFTNNTLMTLRVNGQPVPALREVRLSAPGTTSVASGWHGYSESAHVVTLPHDIGKTPMFFGDAKFVAREKVDEITYEVYQYSSGVDVTQSVLDLVKRLAPAYGEALSRKFDRPLRLFITDTGGGQKTDHGLLLQPWHEAALDPIYKQLIAHELFHEWLGGFIAASDESLTWFQEGFTDYLALWQLASLGEIDREWFAQRLSDINDAARQREAYGNVWFADPRVSWRDWDGSNETLAYSGGAILAFGLDMELRKQGKRGLSALIADLIESGATGYTKDDLRRWLREQVLESYWDAYVEWPALPEFAEDLARAGITRTKRISTERSYVGVRIDGDVFGVAEAIDPGGPAASSGLSVGDWITGYWPVRGNRPLIGADVETRFTFGLNAFPPQVGEINIGFRRGSEEMHARVQPRMISGGYRMGFDVDSHRADRYFR